MWMRRRIMRATRRDFLKTACLAPLCVAAQETTKRPIQTLKVSLNAYSFNKLLNDSIRGRGEGVTLLQLLEFAARNKFDGIDATGYYFPGYPEVPTDAC